MVINVATHTQEHSQHTHTHIYLSKQTDEQNERTPLVCYIYISSISNSDPKHTSYKQYSQICILSVKSFFLSFLHSLWLYLSLSLWLCSFFLFFLVPIPMFLLLPAHSLPLSVSINKHVLSQHLNQRRWCMAKKKIYPSHSICAIMHRQTNKPFI